MTASLGTHGFRNHDEGVYNCISKHRHLTVYTNPDTADAEDKGIFQWRLNDISLLDDGLRVAFETLGAATHYSGD